MDQDSLQALQLAVVSCTQCPRLVEHRERVARTRRRMYMDWEYWGKPLPSFGDHQARLLIVGLAPAAHGGNRTGRMFTGAAAATCCTAPFTRSDSPARLRLVVATMAWSSGMPTSPPSSGVPRRRISRFAQSWQAAGAIYWRSYRY